MDAAIPLVGLDAVVIDTETTGLETKSARIVQMAAVRIVKGRIDDGDPFVTLVDPGEPIPAAATAVHGVADADVAGAPGFAEACSALWAYVGTDMLIGQTIAFDMAVMAAECARAGLPFRPLPTLDTELLAEIANPALPGTDIELLAAWLGVAVVDRHTALGDALTTARIFTGLVPHLRERGIRTRGEAEAACRGLLDARAAAGRVGLAPPEVVRSERPLARIDAYPFRHLNRDLMSSPPQVVAADLPIAEAIAAMTGAKVSSLFVSDAGGTPEAIVTERDVMRAVAADGAGALARPVGAIASAPLVTVAAGDHIHRAIGRMTARGIRHLAVVDGDGTVVGALSARDLLRLRASEAITLGDAIDTAADVGALAAAWARLPAVAAALLDEEVAAIDVAAIVSREIAAVTARAAAIGEARLVEAGRGPSPADYAVLVLGSGGRGESLLAADQDNAIVYADGADDGDVGKTDAWFADLGRHIADILHECGIPYCKGGVMAKNPEWRRSVSGWKATVDRWVTRSNPQDLLFVDIFFDLAAAHGVDALADEIWQYAYDSGAHHADFAKLLAEASAGFQPPISFFGGLRSEEGRVDLKLGGLLPIVSGARVLSICHHLPARSTPERLVGISRLGIGGAGDLENLVEVHRLILDHMLRQQVEDIAAGVPPSNKVDVRRLSQGRRNELRNALKSLRGIETMVRDMIFATPRQS